MFNEEVYSTQNLYEGSYLLCCGYKLAGKAHEGHKVTITFQGSGVTSDALKFYNKAKVEAKAFADAYRTLKDFVFTR